MEAYHCGRDPTQKVRAGKLNQQYLNSLKWDRMVNMLRGGTLGAMWSELEKNTDQDYGTIEELNPALFFVKANADDNPTWNQAMGGENAEGYWQACIKEYEVLLKKDVWVEVIKESWMKIIPSTWAFKCKRFPDGLVRKLKSRFCAMGCCQTEGVDFFETFAPVVNWQTVRIMLVMSLLLGLATKQVDYTAAFVHADIDRDPNWENMTDLEKERSGVYIQMPRGFAKQGYVLKLKKSLYGLKQSPRNFFLHLKGQLERVGLEQSNADQCLFVNDKVICLVYVDDTLFFGQNEEDIANLIADLRTEMDFEEEDNVAGFLGVHIERRADGTIHLTQKGLIARIIKALNIGDQPTKRTPAEHGCLGKDEFGDPPDATFSYPSVIGMLGYLHGHTRPDITFAVSQCSRYTHSPRRSHENALIRIGCYLKGTKERGLIFKPSSLIDDFLIDCYVDADFAGMWGHEDPQDPSCVKSRTGYVICIMNCPVFWASKLQTDIATSTMEAEYNAFSMAMRALIPLQHLAKAIVQGLGAAKLGCVKIKTVAHEDNTGCLKLTKMDPGRMTPRSKHYGVKYHWFRGKLQPNKIEVDYIESKAQRADFLTKSLRTVAFEYNRLLTCGW
jgi:hypothetical protein